MRKLLVGGAVIASVLAGCRMHDSFTEWGARAAAIPIGATRKEIHRGLPPLVQFEDKYVILSQGDKEWYWVEDDICIVATYGGKDGTLSKPLVVERLEKPKITMKNVIEVETTFVIILVIFVVVIIFIVFLFYLLNIRESKKQVVNSLSVARSKLEDSKKRMTARGETESWPAWALHEQQTLVESISQIRGEIQEKIEQAERLINEKRPRYKNINEAERLTKTIENLVHQLEGKINDCLNLPVLIKKYENETPQMLQQIQTALTVAHAWLVILSSEGYKVGSYEEQLSGLRGDYIKLNENSGKMELRDVWLTAGSLLKQLNKINQAMALHREQKRKAPRYSYDDQFRTPPDPGPYHTPDMGYQ